MMLLFFYGRNVDAREYFDNLKTVIFISPGLGALATTALGLTGIMTASSMCLVPFCRAQSGQCCLLGGSSRGIVCPRAC